ncbi:MAG: hypothetical protein ACNA71_04480, partial [Kiritimatiellia bacterium]
SGVQDFGHRRSEGGKFITNTDQAYEQEERTALFGEAVIDLVKNVPLNPVMRRLVNQLVGTGTSIGANYCEAVNCVLKKGFSTQDVNLPTRSS